MPHSTISTLLTRNLQDVFGENAPRAAAPPSTSSRPKTACFTTPVIRASLPSISFTILRRCRGEVRHLWCEVNR